ncbi:hypothetical protein QQ045_017633 [Rhodiola kirilowii]
MTETNKAKIYLVNRMINGHDFYMVLSAMMPLYVAMILAYGSVRWWKIFTPDQCAGINRFVQVFAIPFLCFNLISKSDPYAMNLKFIAADTLQKIIVLAALIFWASFTKRASSLDWLITIFSLSALPTTLVIGIPLLVAMYGEYCQSLMVQIIVLQCIIWYTLLLFLYEYRAAKTLIIQQFPNNAGSIVSLKLDSDIVSLDENDCLETDSTINSDGKLHVTVRKSNVSRSRSLDDAPRPSSFTETKIYPMSRAQSYPKRHSSFGSGANDPPTVDKLLRIELEKFQRSDLSTKEVRLLVSGNVPIRESRESRAFAFIGLFMALQPNLVSCGKKWAAYSMAMRFITGPGVMAAASLIVGIRGDLLKVAIVQVYESHCACLSANFQNSGHPFLLNCKFASYSTGSASSSNCREVHLLQLRDPPIFQESKYIVLTLLPEHPTSVKPWLQTEWNPEKQVTPTGSTAGLYGVGVSKSGTEKHMPPTSVMTRMIMMMVWRKLIRNPNIYSTFFGLIWSLIQFRWNFELPIILDKSITILSDTGLGMAMFALGAFMGLQSSLLPCGKAQATYAMVARFIIGPAVMSAASIIVGIRNDLFRVAIVQAALPQATVPPFVFANEYNVHPQILCTSTCHSNLLRCTGIVAPLPIDIADFEMLMPQSNFRWSKEKQGTSS